MSERGEAAGARARPLRRRGFRALFLGDCASQAGTELGAFAVPVLAVTALGAGPREMGWLTAAESAAFLVVGLPAGAWVDRWTKRRVLVVADLIRAALLATIPLAWALDALTLAQLYAVALAVGVCTVFFDVAYQSVLPALVGPEELVPANARLQAVASTAQVAGPALGGGLLRWVPAPTLIGLDALSFLASAAAISRIRESTGPAPREPGAPRLRVRDDVRVGLRFVMGHPLLRRIVATTALCNLFGAGLVALTPLLLLRELGLSAQVMGLIYTVGAAGGLLAALASSAVARRLGAGPTLVVSTSVGIVGVACYPLSAALTSRTLAVALLLAAGVVVAFSIVVYNVTQVSFRQRLCPPELLGRMNATIRFLVWGAMPVGGLAAGTAGEALGVVPALWVAAAGTATTVLPLVTSPLRSMRDLGAPAEPRAALPE